MQQLRQKAQIMDGSALSRALMRMSHQIVEKNRGIQDVCLAGILRRGAVLAEQVQRNIETIEGVRIPCGSLDIGFYRDELSQLAEAPLLRRCELPFDVTGKTIVLVDDVLYTGRTTRAAIEAIFTAGRPRAIQLLVLIDRGHRELPFRADYVGKNIPTSHSELVEVRVPPYDAETGVWLMDIA